MCAPCDEKRKANEAASATDAAKTAPAPKVVLMGAAPSPELAAQMFAGHENAAALVAETNRQVSDLPAPSTMTEEAGAILKRGGFVLSVLPDPAN